MIVAFLYIEALQLSHEDVDEHVLVGQGVRAEAQLDILHIWHEDQEEFESGVHSEFSEQYWRRTEGKAKSNLIDLEMLDIDLFDISLGFH